MTECSQTNVPVIQIVEDPCKGTHTASSCIYHEPPIVALGFPQPDSSLQDIITALVGVIQQQASSINQLEEAATPTYKVYTALLTQSGGDNIQYINWDDDPNTLTIGVTYTITENTATNFIPNGAPNNNVGTSFIATSSIVDWDNSNIGPNQVSFNTGAPVVTVLENTIGNVWFTYLEAGVYQFNSDELFTLNKTLIFIGNAGSFIGVAYSSSTNSGELDMNNPVGAREDSTLLQTPIEIRVYN